MDNIVEEFLKLGADPNIQNNNGVTPLMIACAANNVLFIQTVLKFHPDVDLTIRDRWGHQAIDYCFQKEVRDLLQEYL